MIKRNLFFNIILSISTLVFPLITFPYASRILGPKGIGSVNFIDNFTQYFALFAALGVPIYGIREVSRMKRNSLELNKIFSEIFSIHIISTIIFSVVYLIIALTVRDINKHLPLVLVGIASMYFNVFAVEWFYQGIEQFAYIAKRSLIVRSLSVVLLFVFLKQDSEPIVYSLVFASIAFLNGLVNILLLRKHIKFQFHNLEFRKHIKPLILLFSSAIAVSVYTLMDNVILGFIKGEIAVGIYSTALKIVRIPFALIIAIGSVIIPQVSRAYTDRRMDNVNLLINKSFAFTCIIGLPVVSGLYVSSSFLVWCFAGAEFFKAGAVIRILCPVVMLIGINSLLGTQLFTPMGREKHLLKLAVVCMIFSLTCNIVLIPFYSYNGAAITNVLTEALLAVMLLYIVKRDKPVIIQTKIFFQCFGAALMFIPLALLIRMLNLNYLIKEMVVIVVCVLFYITYLLFFSGNSYVKTLNQLVLSKINFKSLNK